MPAERLLVVDDHAVLSGAMADSLRACGFGDVNVADPDDLDREAVLALAGDLRPDLVLLDLSLGQGRSGLPLITPLTELGAKVVVLSASRDRTVLAECLQAGARGLLDKAMRFDDLVAAIRRALAGEILVDQYERQALLSELERRREQEQERLGPFLRLTDREREVLSLLLDGRAPKQIARDRSVSTATVRNQIHAILSKLGVSSEREALSLARAAGWQDRSPSTDDL